MLHGSWRPKVQGRCCIELYAGVAAISLSLLFLAVPCMVPWGIIDGEHLDIVHNGQVILALLQWKILGFIHIAQPCQSFTLARIPQLRNWNFVNGLPNLIGRSAELVQQGNTLAHWSATLAAEAVAVGAWLIIENPSRSFLWVTEGIKSVHALLGVVFISVMFGNVGAGYVKPTHLL